MAVNDFSLSDLAAVVGNSRDGDGLGGDNGILWLLLFILIGGFGNRGYGGGYGNGAGGIGGNELYPWLNQQQNINDGFRDQMLNGTINGIQSSVTSGFGDVQNALCSGFAGVNSNISNGFMQTQMGMLQGFNGVQAQQAQCCCDNQLAMANQTATILAEHCSDRAALSDGIRDVIQASNAGTQRIIDQLCQDKLDAKNDEIAQLRQQLNMQQLAASQAAQNAFITQGFSNEVDALYNRLSNCPVPSMPVYGRTPIFTCASQNQGCGCGCGCAA